MITIARCVRTDVLYILRTRYQDKSNRRCLPIAQIMRCHAHRQSATHSSAHRKARKANSQSPLSSQRALQTKPRLSATPEEARRKARASLRDEDKDLAWVRSWRKPWRSDSSKGAEGSTESVSKSLVPGSVAAEGEESDEICGWRIG